MRPLRVLLLAGAAAASMGVGAGAGAGAGARAGAGAGAGATATGFAAGGATEAGFGAGAATAAASTGAGAARSGVAGTAGACAAAAGSGTVVVIAGAAGRGAGALAQACSSKASNINRSLMRHPLRIRCRSDDGITYAVRGLDAGISAASSTRDRKCRACARCFCRKAQPCPDGSPVYARKARSPGACGKSLPVNGCAVHRPTRAGITGLSAPPDNCSRAASGSAAGPRAAPSMAHGGCRRWRAGSRRRGTRCRPG